MSLVQLLKSLKEELKLHRSYNINSQCNYWLELNSQNYETNKHNNFQQIINDPQNEEQQILYYKIYEYKRCILKEVKTMHSAKGRRSKSTECFIKELKQCKGTFYNVVTMINQCSDRNIHLLSQCMTTNKPIPKNIKGPALICETIRRMIEDLKSFRMRYINDQFRKVKGTVTCGIKDNRHIHIDIRGYNFVVNLFKVHFFTDLSTTTVTTAQESEMSSDCLLTYVSKPTNSSITFLDVENESTENVLKKNEKSKTAITMDKQKKEFMKRNRVHPNHKFTFSSDSLNSLSQEYEDRNNPKKRHKYGKKGFKKQQNVTQEGEENNQSKTNNKDVLEVRTDTMCEKIEAIQNNNDIDSSNILELNRWVGAEHCDHTEEIDPVQNFVDEKGDDNFTQIFNIQQKALEGKKVLGMTIDKFEKLLSYDCKVKDFKGAQYKGLTSPQTEIEKVATKIAKIKNGCFVENGKNIIYSPSLLSLPPYFRKYRKFRKYKFLKKDKISEESVDNGLQNAFLETPSKPNNIERDGTK